jgi:hypothetical protein
MYFRLMGKLIRVPTFNLAPIGAMNLVVILYGVKSQYMKTCLHCHLARFSLFPLCPADSNNLMELLENR